MCESVFIVRKADMNDSTCEKCGKKRFKLFFFE